MPRYTKHRFQIGEWWLSQRSGSPAWYATFYDQRPSARDVSALARTILSRPGKGS